MLNKTTLAVLLRSGDLEKLVAFSFIKVLVYVGTLHFTGSFHFFQSTALVNYTISNLYYGEKKDISISSVGDGYRRPRYRGQ